MRNMIVGGVTAVVMAACTATPGATVIVERDAPPTAIAASDASTPSETSPKLDLDAGAAADVDASVADAGPMACSGPDQVGQASDNCEARGPCSLNTCAGGEAFTCTGPSGAGAAYGYPKDLVGCVESAADESALSTGLGRVHCCERACVRHSQNDGACRGIVFSCPKGILPVAPSGTTVCNKSTEGVSDYCCR